MFYNVEILNRDGTLVSKYENVKTTDYVDTVVFHRDSYTFVNFVLDDKVYEFIVPLDWCVKVYFDNSYKKTD